MRSSRTESVWYKKTLFIFLVILILVAAAGSAIGLKFIVFSSQAATPVEQAEAGVYESVETDTPLASATDQMVASMSIEEKIGQMMMVGFDGTEPSEALKDAINKQHVGGIYLTTRNVASPEQVTATNASLQKLAMDAGLPLKMMIAISQEGGKSRKIEQIGPYYSQPMIGEMHDTAPIVAQQQASVTARELRQLGINTNLAPVADVTSGWGTVMDGRSFNSDAQFTAELCAAAVKGYRGAVTISGIKHFPGYGSADGDSEKTLATVESDQETLQNTDLLPFAAAIKEGVPMVMVANLSVPALDPSGKPASLSSLVVNDLLRGKMGFTGVVISENLEMGSITEERDVGEAAVAAVTAGVDIILVADTAENQKEAFDSLVEAVKAGTLREADIDRSLVRIIEMKKKYRLEM